MSNMDIQGIEAKIDEVRHSLNTEYQRGAVRDEAKIADLQQQLDDLTNQLEVEQRLAQHEERIEESQTEIAYFLDNMTIEDISMRELCRNEEAYQLLRTVVQQTMMGREEKLLGEIKTTKEQLDATKAEKENTQKQYDDLYEISAQQRNEINALKAQLEDAEHKRDAAAAELEEQKAEVERLNSQVDDLRQEIAVGAKNAVKVVDVEQSLAAYKKQRAIEEQSKPAIYDVESLDFKNSKYKAKLAETGEPIEFGWLQKNSYREVTAEEAELFRQQRAAAEAERGHADTAQPGNGVAQTEDGLKQEGPFRDEETSPANGLDEGYASREVAAKTVEERLEALERKVFGVVKGEAA